MHDIILLCVAKQLNVSQLIDFNMRKFRAS